LIGSKSISNIFCRVFGRITVSTYPENAYGELRHMIDLQFNGLFGLLILIADIYAIVKTVQSNAETLTKVLWIVVILFLPLLGVILWYFFGPRG